MLVYLFSALIFLVLGAEFLAILLLVVYVELFRFYSCLLLWCWIYALLNYMVHFMTIFLL